MKELVFKNENGKPTTNSLLVAQKFGKEHKNVLRDIENLKKDVLKFEQMFIKSIYLDSYNRDQEMYTINRDGFTLLAMGFTGRKALEFKMEFLDAFNQMEQLLNSDEYILMRSQEILQNKVSLLEARNEAQTKLLNEIAPKAEYYDNTLQSEGTMVITQIAKEMGMSARTLNKKLKELGVQYKINDQWVLYAKYQGKGYTKTNTYTEIINDESKTYTSTVWTQKGREFIHSLIQSQQIA